LFHLRFNNRTKKSKAASIKLTLAAVVLDADKLLRSGARGLVHNKRRRDGNRANLLEVITPKRRCAADYVCLQFVEYGLHKTLSAD
jgi:hypothetical protein